MTVCHGSYVLALHSRSYVLDGESAVSTDEEEELLSDNSEGSLDSQEFLLRKRQLTGF